MMASGETGSVSRRRLANIRCMMDCVRSFKESKPLPRPICYVPAEVEYKSSGNASLVLYRQPCTKSTKITAIQCSSSTRLVASGEELCNAQGEWARVIKYSADKKNQQVFNDEEAWVLVCPAQVTSDEVPVLNLVAEADSKCKPFTRWTDVVEQHYSLQLHLQESRAPADTEAMNRLQSVPPNWSLNCDEEVVQFLAEHADTSNENLGSIKNYVESIDVSSYCDEDGAKNLTDGDADTFWESDGSQGRHWVRLKMKKGTVIKKLLVTIDGNDDNYMPSRIVVMGGDQGNMKELNETPVDLALDRVIDLAILDEQREHFPYIEIWIKECKDDGIDTRIHAIKIKSTREKEMGLSKDLFKSENLVRYPKLESFNEDILYRRTQVLLRFVNLLDSVLPYLVPAWEYSIGSYHSLQTIRQFLTLSKRRSSLIDRFLMDTYSRPARMPKLYINRRLAAEHRADPSQDPDCKNTVFNQIYEGLKPRDQREKPLDYRWPSRHDDQWWECKFIAEGIIDQGGGFRDSLSDLADELCPSASDVPVPLPFFVRSPNQSLVGSNINRDVYVPNPSCKELHKYEWIGKLMGACLRGRESLVLTLPMFFWKQLAGESVTWSRDFYTVDAAEVKLIDNLENMTEELFKGFFADLRKWQCLLSDGTVVPLKPNGTEISVTYVDRLEYAEKLKQTRMHEADAQVGMIRQGLLSVVPQAVLDLLTWQELEKRICGDPVITVESLKKTTHYEDLDATDSRVVNMWEALSNFSCEDLSRFLRFVTGRRRLPAPIYICPGKEETSDALPESSTCANTLYLPNYSSAKLAEEKLRYAAYNCIAIDTDMSPWED